MDCTVFPKPISSAKIPLRPLKLNIQKHMLYYTLQKYYILRKIKKRLVFNNTKVIKIPIKISVKLT